MNNKKLGEAPRLTLKRNTDIYDLKRQSDRDSYFENQEFRNYFINKNPEKVAILDNEKRSKKRSSKMQSENVVRNSSINERPRDYLKFKTKYAHIDSAQRELALYPNPNFYVVNNINYRNVISATLSSCYFINTLLTVKSTPIGSGNNKIYWQNQSDIFSGETYTYVVTIPDGNYNATTLESAILEAMNSVRRIGLNASLHNINIDIDQSTDTTTFESFESSVFANPFTVQGIPAGGEDFTDIEVNYTSWETKLEIGDAIIIENSGDVDGISAVFINGEHIIREKLSSDTFVIRVNAIATSLAADVGGDAVIIKNRLTWKLLWEEPESMFSLLGFSKINTAFETIHLNTQETFKNFDIAGDGLRVKINYASESDISNNFTKINTVSEHNLVDGDVIYINSNIDEGLVYDHFRDEVILTDTEAEDLQRFISLLYNPSGLIISNVDAKSFTVPVPYEEIGPVEAYIGPDGDLIPDWQENGDIILKTKNASIKLTPNPVIYFCCNELGRETESLNDLYMNNENENLKNVFTPIFLPGNGLSSVFDTFMPIKKHFYEVPRDISSLTIQFRTSDGNLVDFAENDHNFMITFETVEQKLHDNNLSSQNNFYS